MIKQSRKLLIETNTSCNTNCVYCYNHNTKQIYNTPTSMFLLPPKYVVKWNIDEVVITGGEPLLEIVLVKKIAKYYKMYHIKDIELITNGLLLSRENIDELQKVGVNYFSLSCDGYNKTMLSQRGYSSEEVWRKIDILNLKKKNKFKVNIIYTLTSKNSSKDEIQDTIRIALKKNIDGVKFQPVSVAHLHKKDNLRIPKRKLGKIMDWLKEKANEWPIINTKDFFEKANTLICSKRNYAEINCEVPRKTVFISALGNFRICPLLSERKISSSQITDYDCHLYKSIKCYLKMHCLCMF